MRIYRLFLYFTLSLFTANCSLDIGIEDISGPDFLLSKIVSATSGVADGVSNLTLTIELRSSNGIAIADFTPQLAVTAGSGITYLLCSASNKDGISVCQIRSTVAGNVTLHVSNVEEIELLQNVSFSQPPLKGVFLQIVSSAQNDQPTSDAGSGSFSVTSQVGSGISGQFQEVGGYKVYLNTTSTILQSE